MNKTIVYITKGIENVNYFVEKKYIDQGNILITSSLEPLKELFQNSPEIGFDTEFNNLRFWKSQCLLASFSDGENTIVIQPYGYTRKDFLFMEEYSGILIGHNIVVDLIQFKHHYQIELNRVWDTLIVEQRLTMGATTISRSLEDTLPRRLNIYLTEDKKTREEFIKMTYNSPILYHHIKYAAGDVVYMKKLKEAQEVLVKKYNMEFLINQIENPLVPIVRDMNMEGIGLNRELWSDLIRRNKIELTKVEKELDEELKRLAQTYPDLLNKSFTKSKGQRPKTLRRQRRRSDVVNLDLFGSHSVLTTGIEGTLNYSSSTQVLNVFEICKQPKPVEEERKNGQIIFKPSVKAPVLSLYLEEHEDSPLKDFINKLIEFKEIEKKINSFGEKFLYENYRQGKKNAKLVPGYFREATGKVHTIFKQCPTTTGRFSSGDSKSGFYNTQQIPTDKIDGKALYRIAFTLTPQEIEEDWWLTTSDLSGAELKIMAALSKDDSLKNLGEDLHSPLATASWRAIYKHRADRLLKIINSLEKEGRDFSKYEREYEEALEKSQNLVISKKENTDMRTKYKNQTFNKI